ncbi:nuclear pore complex protein Nup85-like [Corticium candelabrum]|uniref:nuclear pore complex protein Nup85-like n=1 Tax=Corticium candelabrum TaxID=121492 RepID=UPI002E340092|nr:nuclear pore complex protein Nup85-like [Corticium candelabrum]XP_062507598.1 nuclear pore complex protein Nup85-like [Corticium candelabrum]
MSLIVYPTTFGRLALSFPSLGGTATCHDSPIQEIAQAKEWNVCTRKLANQSHGVFMDLQEVGVGVGQQQSLVKLSRSYRAIIHACVLDLNNAADRADDSLVSNYQEQCQLFEMTELMWHLSEILFIECAPASSVLPCLLEWVRWHNPRVTELAYEITNHPAPGRHPEYWDVIKLLILHGKPQEARNLLMQHPARRHGIHDGFSILDELLRKMPLQSYGNHSVSEFTLQWQHWREECLLRLHDGTFNTNTNLEHIAKLLCGDREAFIEAKHLCGSWYFLMVSRLLFSDPAIQAINLHMNAQPSILLMDDNDAHWTKLDDILLAMLKYDIPQVISLISSVFGNWWFVAHLADLLHHAGQLESHQLEYGSSMREFLLLEYGSSLMSHTSLWQLGVDYFLQCSVYGKQYLETYLDRIAPDSDMKAIKVLRLCNKSGLTELGCSICKKMAMKAKQSDRLGSSLNWAIRSKNASFASIIANKFLSQYAESGSFPCLDVVDHLNPAMLINDQIIFLAKYREFHRLYSYSRLKEAACLLVNLLTSRLAPKEYWFMLLIDCLPLLELDEVVFATDQTYELLQCLEEIEGLRELDGKGGEDDIDTAHTEKVQLVRIGLATNLARASLDDDTDR